MNILPSRRVKRLLRIVDTMHDNAVRTYMEKKAAFESAQKNEDEDDQAKDLVTLLRKQGWRSRTC